MKFFFGFLSFFSVILLNTTCFAETSGKIQRFPFSQYQLKNIKNSCSDSEFKINEEKIRDFLKKAVVIDEKARHDRYLNLPCNVSAKVEAEGKSYALKINSGKTAELNLSPKQTLILGCNRCTSWGEAYSEKGSPFSLKNYSLKDI